MKQISPAQHSLITFQDGKGWDILAKPGESQDSAIKRLNAQLKRRKSAPHKNTYPIVRAGVSVREYVKQFWELNNLKVDGIKNIPDVPATLVWDDSVAVSIEA